MDWMKVFRTAEISGATSSVWRWLILVFVIFIKSSSAGQINITAVSGKNATLLCRVLDGNKTINGLEWSKPELETEYVFIYRDSKPDQTKQHASFKDRADLKDRQMKDGDVSLILNNVTTADAGIYEIRISPRTKRRKRANLGGDPICIIYLRVVPPVKKNITAGETVVLPCQAPNTNSNPNAVVEWSRADLTPKYVLLYRNKQFVLEEQDPSFKNRVDLQDRQMKDGDVSLILKDVTTSDAGTYECRVIQMGATRSNTDPISIIYLSVDPPVKKNITAGETVVLPCQAPNTNSNPNAVVEWSRADLTPKYVLLYRNKQFVLEEQDPSFKNRVDLQDRQMKDGDVSLILKDVTTSDAGTYECRVIQMGATRSNTDPISIIYLSVDPPGPPIGLKTVLLMATAVLVVAIAGGIFFYRRCEKPQKPKNSEESDSLIKTVS